MDGNRFDELTRAVASGGTRRALLKQALGAAAALAGLGGAAEASAARRPTPTPRPVQCPGQQVFNGSACVCPSGTRCGSDCCPDGVAVCCDDACCYGTCYGEERCCPTGQIVCNGICLPAGQCCVDGDCGPGFACIANTCVCVPTVSCASAGRSCGSLTDDCGNLLDCGACTPPEVCGDDGRCTCTTTTTCEGKCGSVTTNCGGVLECGDTCGLCQTCGASNVCVPGGDGDQCGSGCTRAICAQGECVSQATIDCPPAGPALDPDAACLTYSCVQTAEGPVCQGSPGNEGNPCDLADPCLTGACVNGVCAGTTIACPTCQACSGGACEPSSGEVCGEDRRCVAGVCSHFPSVTPPDSVDVERICAAERCTGTSVCCPGANNGRCCDSFDACFLDPEGGVLRSLCCPEASICGDQCCSLAYTCADGVCYRSERICADGNVCEDTCCGSNGGPGSGFCCEAGTRCVDDQCERVPTGACSSRADCGSNAICAGLVVENGVAVQPGICCLANYAVEDPVLTEQFGFPYYHCCPAGRYPSVLDGFCCTPETLGCPQCACSSISVRRWGR